MLLALGETEVSAERANEAIQRILARPEFAPESRTLLDRGRDAVLERLGGLIDALTGAGTGVVVAWFIVAVLVVVVMVLALRFSRGLRGDPVLATVPPALARRSATDWRADAAEHESTGAWRAALRCRWRALVAELAGQGLIQDVPGCTAGEYRRQVAEAAPAAGPDFALATAIFEDAWYGDLPAGPAEGEQLRTLADRVLAATGVPA